MCWHARVDWHGDLCRERIARVIVTFLPGLVPASMTLVFRAAHRRLPPTTAYHVGFSVYWAGWCLAVPILLIGRRRTLDVLTRGARPTLPETALLVLPVAGAVGGELLPHRAEVSPRVAAVMLGSGLLNAVGEELLWRGLPLALFPEDVVRGAVAPLVGFALWHLAPQVVLPSRHGRWRFVAGSAVVGLTSAVVAWRGRGLRWVVLPHALTDSCGVTAARFRLGLTPQGFS